MYNAFIKHNYATVISVAFLHILANTMLLFLIMIELLGILDG